LYGMVAVISLSQLVRTTGGGNTKPLCKDILRLQHISVIAVCLARAAVLLISNALVDQPGVTVLLFQVATFLMMAVFGVQGFQWGRIGLFTLNLKSGKRFRFVSALALALFFGVSVSFPVLVLTAEDREAGAQFAKLGAYVMGGLTMLFSLVLAFLGCSLLRQLRSTSTASNKNLTTTTQAIRGFSALERRLAHAIVSFTLCFFLQGLSYIFVVQENALNDEIAFSLFPIAFHLLDCVALLALLWLFSRAIAARANLSHAKRMASSATYATTQMATF